MITVYNSDKNEGLAGTDVTVCSDGRRYTVPAGTRIRLTPGESITISPYLYHDFHVEKGTGAVLLGEVSMCNDDKSDNRFLRRWEGFQRLKRMSRRTGCCVMNIQRHSNKSGSRMDPLFHLAFFGFRPPHFLHLQRNQDNGDKNGIPSAIGPAKRIPSIPKSSGRISTSGIRKTPAGSWKAAGPSAASQ